jgi:hypothetical protein
VSGAVLLVVVSGMALGIVSVSPSGLRLRLGSPTGQSRPVAGADGVHPGGTPQTVPVTVRNASAEAFEISGVRADLSGLPGSCPAPAWRVGQPEILSTVPARSEVTVPLPVSLTVEAPTTCQGVTARFPVILEGIRHGAGAQTSATVRRTGQAAGRPPAPRRESLTAEAVVRAGRLGSPGGTLSVRNAVLGIAPSPPARGPVPSSFDVEALDGSDRRSPVCMATTGLCLDRKAAAAAPRRYVVTARLGLNWRQESAVLQAWSPPPAPDLRFSDGTTSALVLTARGGTSAYSVVVHLDGAVAPFHTARVTADSTLTEIVKLPALDAGTHRIVAVSRFHGLRAPSATLHVAVSRGGDPTPRLPDEPAGVSSDPANPSLTTSGPAGPAPSGPKTVTTTPRPPHAPVRHAPPQEPLPEGRRTAPPVADPNGVSPVTPVVPTAAVRG